MAVVDDQRTPYLPVIWKWKPNTPDEPLRFRLHDNSLDNFDCLPDGSTVAVIYNDVLLLEKDLHTSQSLAHGREFHQLSLTGKNVTFRIGANQTSTTAMIPEAT